MPMSPKQQHRSVKRLMRASKAFRDAAIDADAILRTYAKESGLGAQSGHIRAIAEAMTVPCAALLCDSADRWLKDIPK